MRKKIVLIISGIVLSLLIVEFVLRAAGLVIDGVHNRNNLAAIKAEGTCRILCLGESTTRDQYPPYLQEYLNSNGPKIKYTVIDGGNYAVSSTKLIDDLGPQIDKYKPNIIVAMMGINDTGNIVPWRGNSNFLGKLRVFRLLLLIKENIIHIRDNVPAGNKSIGETGSGNAVGYGKDDMYRTMVQLNNKASLRNPVVMFSTEEKQVPKNLPGIEQKYSQYNDFSDPQKFITCGWRYYENNDPSSAENIFNRLMKDRRADVPAHISQAWYMMNTNQNDKAREILEQAQSMRNFGVYGALALKCLLEKKYGIAGEIFSKTELLRESYYNEETFGNYRRLIQIAKANKIRLVCMQYPVRSIKPLKKMLNGFNDIVYVDNEAIFKNALRTGEYQDLFLDQFAGDFGHCTPEGNKMIAENLGKAILRETK